MRNINENLIFKEGPSCIRTPRPRQSGTSLAARTFAVTREGGSERAECGKYGRLSWLDRGLIPALRMLKDERETEGSSLTRPSSRSRETTPC